MKRLMYIWHMACFVAVSAAMLAVLVSITLPMLLDNDERSILFSLFKGE